MHAGLGGEALPWGRVGRGGECSLGTSRAVARQLPAHERARALPRPLAFLVSFHFCFSFPFWVLAIAPSPVVSGSLNFARVSYPPALLPLSLLRQSFSKVSARRSLSKPNLSLAGSGAGCFGDSDGENP